jgi:hypothetical protein
LKLEAGQQDTTAMPNGPTNAEYEEVVSAANVIFEDSLVCQEDLGCAEELNFCALKSNGFGQSYPGEWSAPVQSQNSPLAPPHNGTFNPTFSAAVTALDIDMAATSAVAMSGVDELDPTNDEFTVESWKKTERCFKHAVLDQDARTILVNWIAECISEFNWSRQTFHLSVQYLDRFLHSSDSIDEDELQEIALLCALIASKIEEYRSHTLRYMLEHSASEMSLDAFKQLEWDI